MDDLQIKLDSIMSRMAKGFTYETDQEQYGVEEKWVMPSSQSLTMVGDCEDFALACRKLCRAENIQTRLVVCTVDGVGHCVLEASGWILDCNYDEAKSRDELEKQGYVWYYISGFNPRDDWRMIVKT